MRRRRRASVGVEVVSFDSISVAPAARASLPRMAGREDFRRDDVGSPHHADGAGHTDRADRDLDRDWNAALTTLAPHHFDSIAMRAGMSAQSLAIPDLP